MPETRFGLFILCQDQGDSSNKGTGISAPTPTVLSPFSALLNWLAGYLQGLPSGIAGEAPVDC